MALIIKTSTEEILIAKFSRTISTLQGYITEAKGDITVGTTYRPTAVLNRLLSVKLAFESDLAGLSLDIKHEDQ